MRNQLTQEITIIAALCCDVGLNFGSPFMYMVMVVMSFFFSDLLTMLVFAACQLFP